jgi:hypothetical protein
MKKLFSHSVLFGAAPKQACKHSGRFAASGVGAIAILGLVALVALAGTIPARAQVPPQLLHYQGRVADNNGNFNGQGQFKFALVNGDGTVSYWSNDGQSGVNLEPATHVQLLVDHGLFSVLPSKPMVVRRYDYYRNDGSALIGR